MEKVTNQTDSVNIHHNLHVILTLLAKSHPSTKEFKETVYDGMFRVANQKGFYEVVYFLLVIVNPSKCKAKFMWPLLDRKMEQEFRKGVQEFIAELNKEDPDACIPTITASMQHCPFGEKVVNFLTKLAQYVMRKQLKEQFELSVMDPVQNIGLIKSRAMRNILKSRIQKESKDLCEEEKEYDKYESDKTQKLNYLWTAISQENVNIQKQELEEEFKTLLTSPTLHGDLKIQIQNEDNNVLDEWCDSFYKEMDIIEAELISLESLQKRISDFRALIETAEERKKSPPYLDGDRLKINLPAEIPEVGPVCNSKGELSLEKFFHYVNYITEKLRKDIQKYLKVVGSDSKLSLEELTSQFSKSEELKISLENKLQEIKPSILSMQTKLYPHYETYQKIFPENFFECPEVKFQENLNTSNLHFKLDNSIQLIKNIRKKLRGRRRPSILCSIKQKACSISTKKVTKIPRSVRNFTKTKLSISPADTLTTVAKTEKQSEKPASRTCLTLSTPKKVIYSKSILRYQQQNSNKSKTVLENKLDTSVAPHSSPLKFKRISRISFSPKLDSIPDFIIDSPFTETQEEGLLSVEQSFIAAESSENWLDSMQLLQNTSFPEGSENDSELSIELEEEKENNKQKEEPKMRRASIEALINRYKEHKEKHNNPHVG